MKKNFTKTLLACVLCVMALCLAASAEKVPLLPDDEGKFTATYQGVAGEYYAILIVKGIYTEDETPVISEDTITYISQETAGADGQAVFSKFIPKDPLEDGTVYIGGSDLDKAILFGYLETGKEEATANKITVSKGSTVYFVDGTSKTYDTEKEVTVPAEAGLLYVNTEYKTHAVYAVNANGVATKVNALDNAVLGINDAGIRTKGIHQGIRFRASASDSAKKLTADDDGYEIMEYGFLVTAETAVTNLKDDYTLDMALVEVGKAMKGVAYNKADRIDIVNDIKNERTIFTNVVTNIPKDKTSLNSIIASRPYYILSDGKNEITVYGEITKRSIYEVAKAIKTANGTDYTSNPAYIDEIITIVDGTQTAELTAEIKPDVSFLYE